jgi:deazaflavin-dependent oxidoreductase (nitroreductase family)
MTGTEQPLDSAYEWVADHTRRYVESSGEDGHLWNGVHTLVLTTRGRKSGKLRRNALIYGLAGENYVVVASKGGHDDHPLWYSNLLADPAATIQVGSEVIPVRATTADAARKAALWPMMVGIWPPYEEYQQKTSRDIPVVVLSRR